MANIDWQQYEDELMEDTFRENIKVKHKTKKKQKEKKNVKSKDYGIRKRIISLPILFMIGCGIT